MVATDIVSKNSQTPDKEWSSSLRVSCGVLAVSYSRNTGPWTLMDALEQPMQWKMDEI